MSNNIDPAFIKQQEEYVNQLGVKASGYRDETDKLLKENDRLIELRKEADVKRVGAENKLTELTIQLSQLQDQVNTLISTRESLNQELAQIQKDQKTSISEKVKAETDLSVLLEQEQKLSRDIRIRTSEFVQREVTLENNERMQKTREDDLDHRLAVLNRREQILAQ